MAAAVSCPSGPEDVLKYWFGGDWRQNFQSKWFTRAGSLQRAAVDADIAAKFSSLLFAAEGGMLIQGAPNSTWDGTPRSLAAHIILLDQFSRHIYRSSLQSGPCRTNETQEVWGGELQDGGEYSEGCILHDDIAEKIDRNGKMALDLSLALLSSGEIDTLSIAGECVLKLM